MTTPEGSPAWLEGWLETQRQYWDAMLAGRPPAAPAPAASMPEAFTAGLPESSREVAARMLEFGESYLGVTRQAWQALEAAKGASHAQADLARRLDALKAQFTQGFTQAFPGMAGATAGPGAIPALGPARERQQSAERLAQATLRYQRALADFSGLLGRVASGAVDRLAQRLAGGGDAARPDSLRAVYDLWIDCGEHAYAAAAHTPEFAAAQSALNDALLDLRREHRWQVEDWARALDLPTRAEVNTLIRRVNTLRRRMRELEEEIEQLRGRPQR